MSLTEMLHGFFAPLRGLEFDLPHLKIPRLSSIHEHDRLVPALVLILCIAKMMFVAGETGEPSAETTSLIEQIVHEQVHEIVSLIYLQMSYYMRLI